MFEPRQSANSSTPIHPATQSAARGRRRDTPASPVTDGCRLCTDDAAGRRTPRRRGSLRRFLVPAVIAPTALALIAAGSAAALVRQPHQVTYQIADTAAIVDSSDTVGISDSDLYGATPAVIDQTLDELEATGVTTLRIQIPWAGVEPLPGQYDWSSVDAIVNAAASRNIAILGDISSTPLYAATPGTTPLAGAPTDPSQYGAFAGQVAARYAGKISAYEIYNEPNSAQYFQATDPAAAYTALLKAAYPAIKAADPTATVIGGVVGAGVDYGTFAINPVTFIQSIYADGGEGYFDDLSFHPYQYSTEFSQGATLPNSPLNQIAAIRALMVANGDASKQIWATEYGLPTDTVSPQTQAAFISDFLNAYSMLGYVGPSFIYTAMDGAPGGTDPTDTFGIYNADGTAKPAQQVIAQFIAAHPVTTPVTPPVTPPVTTPPPPNPAAVFAAQVAAYYQAAIQAYLTALSQAFAALGTPAVTPAVVTPTVKAAVVNTVTVAATTPSPTVAAALVPVSASVSPSSTPTAPTAQPKTPAVATVKNAAISAPTTKLASTTPTSSTSAAVSAASTEPVAAKTPKVHETATSDSGPARTPHDGVEQHRSDTRGRGAGGGHWTKNDPS